MAEPSTAQDVWERMAAVLRRSVPKQQFETWFRGMRLVSLEPERIELTVPNNFLREWILKRYANVLRTAIREITGSDPVVEILVTERADGGAQAAPGPQAATPPRSDAASRPAPRHAPPAPPSTPYGESDVILNPQYTFENFVPGPSNNFGYAAALAVADSPGKSYNPLFLHGNVGLGKTHLLQAVCHRMMEEKPHLKILYLSCETFTNHFVTAISNGELDTFRFRYRHVDVLLIDDIHFLANRERTQEEFFHTFNTLYNANKQIILSSDSQPAEIPTLEDRLVSRFKWGIVARLDQPVYETRVAIIARKVRMQGVRFPDEVVQLIAENVCSNIRELEGAVNKIAGMAHVYQRPVDIGLAQEALRDLLPKKSVRISIDDILRTVSEHFGVHMRDLVSRRRPHSIAYPRQICMYLARKLTSHSLEEIGGYFGGRDHTTVMYAYDKIRKEVEVKPETAQIIEFLTSQLTR